MLAKKQCPFCSKVTELEIPKDELNAFYKGYSIKTHCPSLNAFTAETLNSGICPSCQEIVYNKPLPENIATWGTAIGRCENCDSIIYMYRNRIDDATYKCSICNSVMSKDSLVLGETYYCYGVITKVEGLDCKWLRFCSAPKEEHTEFIESVMQHKQDVSNAINDGSSKFKETFEEEVVFVLIPPYQIDNSLVILRSDETFADFCEKVGINAFSVLNTKEEYPNYDMYISDVVETLQICQSLI